MQADNLIMDVPSVCCNRFREDITNRAAQFAGDTAVVLHGEPHQFMNPPFARAGADGISIFDAVDKQLGLKLERGEAPQPVISSTA